MRCSNCGSENPGDAAFCEQCGRKLELLCHVCKAPVSSVARFCKKCGAILDPSSVRSEPVVADGSPASGSVLGPHTAADVTDGERKMVTALFADIRGSTELAQDLDPEEARAIIDPALKLMIEAVRRYDGYVVQSTGDGIFALFGAPVAHEDHPQRALNAAFRMQSEIRRYGDKLLSAGGVPIEIRVGVNTGEVVVRSIETSAPQAEYSPIGHTTNLAARMQAVARSGSIVVSEPTRRLVEGYFTLKTVGPTRVRGITEPVPVYEVTGIGPLRTRLQVSLRRGLTRFVGREAEIQQIGRALELVKAGRGQIVAAIGDPGVGKSRLFFEFKAVSQSGCLVLEALSVSHDKASAYLPLIELLHGYFGLEPRDDSRKRREKVIGRVVALDRNLEDTLPYLFALLGIAEGDDFLAQTDSQVRKRRTLDALKRILLRESLNQPMIVAFEDLHWIDQQTQDFLNLFAGSIATAKILLLVNYRPEYSHQWSNKTYYTQLRLDPLKRESAEEMLTSLLGDAAELVPLKRLVIDNTEGTPFFIEEMVQELFEDGTLVRNGAVKLVRPLTQIKIPATVQAVLASRIDRLPPEERELLHTLAVFGREFPLGLVEGVWQHAHPKSELETMLSRLQAGEFIYEQPAFPEAEYIFKHALTQEVAYHSLLIERRKQIHESAGQALESMHAEQLDDHLAELAHHYSRSGNAPKAVEYLRRASEQAIERSANAEAIGQLTVALDFLKTLPDGPARKREETSFELALGGLLAIATSPGNPEVEHAFSRARELSLQTKDDAQLFHALAGLWYRNQVGGVTETALEIGEELVSQARRSDDPVRLRFAHHALAQALMLWGKIVPALEHVRQSESIIGPAGRATSYHIGDTPSRHLAISSVTFWLAGYPDQALARSRQALALANKLAHGYVSAITRLFCGYFSVNCRRVQDALEHAEATIAPATEYGFSTLLPQMMNLRGWALVHLGRIEEGFEQITRGMALQPRTLLWLLRYNRLLTDACLHAKRAADGLRAAAEGFDILGANRRHFEEPELHRLRGELLLLPHLRAEAQAEICFREAIEIAQQQQAKSWELRATMSLARLLGDARRRDEARTMLAEIYNWFTEGFDTADLKDAKALLDELSA